MTTKAFNLPATEVAGYGKYFSLGRPSFMGTYRGPSSLLLIRHIRMARECRGCAVCLASDPHLDRKNIQKAKGRLATGFIGRMWPWLTCGNGLRLETSTSDSRRLLLCGICNEAFGGIRPPSKKLTTDAMDHLDLCKLSGAYPSCRAMLPSSSRECRVLGVETLIHKLRWLPSTFVIWRHGVFPSPLNGLATSSEDA
ncbi:hypothetical protein BD309DRAFT_250169 [Dichomitus squalens]|nr:hypothetical protein BD309DRAFT_250169 [Dichomitus squalens]